MTAALILALTFRPAEVLDPTGRHQTISRPYFALLSTREGDEDGVVHNHNESRFRANRTTDILHELSIPNRRLGLKDRWKGVASAYGAKAPINYCVREFATIDGIRCAHIFGDWEFDTHKVGWNYFIREDWIALNGLYMVRERNWSALSPTEFSLGLTATDKYLSINPIPASLHFNSLYRYDLTKMIRDPARLKKAPRR